ncbi:MAG: hypothetical protein QOG56_1940 [Solirubrobacteraceae bacterium]|jgi:hypothetical protein|nr:hypothetical protein [Solirubrobacteraceae bacterium]
MWPAAGTSLTRRCAQIVCVIVGIVVLGPAAALVAAQSTTVETPAPEVTPNEEPLANKEAVVSPQAVVTDTKVQDVPSLAGAIQDQQVQATQTNKQFDPADVVVPGSAAFQDEGSKKLEAAQDCRSAPNRETSKMLGTAGVVVSDDGGIWGTVLLLVAAGAALLLIVALVVRGAPAPKDGLQVLATVLAIVSGAVGLLVTFVPGVGGGDRPAEEATMTVREVNPRITLREFAKQTRTSLATVEDKTDLQEVGNVIWLEIALRGYAKQHPVLQYGLYRLKGEVLLDNTAKNVALGVADADAQTSFIPIWVGYPSRSRFQAQFRLLVNDHVRQLAKTGPMNGSTVRYVCSRR